MLKKLLEKLKDNPLKIIGLTLTYLGLALFLVPVFLSRFDFLPDIGLPFIPFLILIVVGPIFLIVSWIINKELIKEGGKMWIIGSGWLILSIFGVGNWLANIMISISLALIVIGIILSVINIIKYNRFRNMK